MEGLSGSALSAHVQLQHIHSALGGLFATLTRLSRFAVIRWLSEPSRRVTDSSCNVINRLCPSCGQILLHRTERLSSADLH